MLAADQHAVAGAFARSGGDKFANLGWEHRAGLPQLTGIAAVLRCSLAVVHPGGDREIAIGRVEAVEVHGRKPLVFHEGTMLHLPPAAWPQRGAAA